MGLKITILKRSICTNIYFHFFLSFLFFFIFGLQAALCPSWSFLWHSFRVCPNSYCKAFRSFIYLFVLLFLFILQPHRVKYLLTLFVFHRAWAIYNPIQAEMVEVDGGMHWRCVWNELSQCRFMCPLHVSLGQSPLHPTFEGFKVQFHLESV